MGRKVYISFKTEDIEFKQAIQAMPGLDYVDKSLNEPIASNDEDYIMRVIREQYLHDSTVTIFLIGTHSAEVLGEYEQRFIKRELQASLATSSLSGKSGILGVVLPSMDSSVYGGTYICQQCEGSHNLVRVDDSRVVREFGYNYYIPNSKCSHSEDDRYCVLVRWADFVEAPEVYIEKAFAKRGSAIASKTRVRP